MMHVPIDDGDAPQGVGTLRVTNQQHCIAEHAIAASPVRLGMVAGRSHQCVSILDPPGKHRIGHRNATPGGQLGDLVTPRADADALAHRAAVRGGQLAHRVDVAIGMKIPQFVALGRPRLEPHQLVGQPAHFEQAQQTSLGLRSFRVMIGLHVRVGAREPGAAARVVPKVALVDE